MEDKMSSIEISKIRLREKLLHWMPKTGDYDTAIENVRIHRRDEIDQLENCIYKPLAVVVVQGYKRSIIGANEYRYGDGHCLISGIDMPSVNYITSATPEKPFLAMSIFLDRTIIRQLAMEIPASIGATGQDIKGVSVADVEEEVFDAFLRLAELLEKPVRISVLAPMVIREIHYCLLIGSQGDFLRQLNTPDSYSNQIAVAASWLRKNFKEKLQMGELAERVHMSTSSLHRHFKRITTLSPLQFQKRLRLHEAQRLMLVDNLDANRASQAVGYESPHQFNREYKRLFGQPPLRDISRLR